MVVSLGYYTEFDGIKWNFKKESTSDAVNKGKCLQTTKTNLKVAGSLIDQHQHQHKYPRFRDFKLTQVC